MWQMWEDWARGRCRSVSPQPKEIRPDQPQERVDLRL
jgi:hypothetical protein